MKNGKEQRRQFATPRASLCVLGQVVRELGVPKALEQVKVPQKMLGDTPAQKLTALLAGMLAGGSTVKETDTTVGIDLAVQRAWPTRLPGHSGRCHLGACGPTAEPYRRPVPALLASRAPVSRWCSGLGGHRSDTPTSQWPGRGVGAGPEQEVVYQGVVAGKAASGLTLLQEAVTQMERVLDLATPEGRALVVVRLDSGCGGEESHRWLLERGYHLLGKMKSGRRSRKLAGTVTQWRPTSSPGREVGAVQAPVDLGQPTQQYAVRTPSEDQPGNVYYAVLVSTLGPTPPEAVEEYDGRAGVGNDFKGEKPGLGWRTRRKRRLAAQEMVVLLAGLARNLLRWCRRWLAQGDVRLGKLGMVRLVREV